MHILTNFAVSRKIGLQCQFLAHGAKIDILGNQENSYLHQVDIISYQPNLSQIQQLNLSQIQQLY